MSRNAIVSITAINAAMSLTTRDFSSVLLITKAKDVKTDAGLPVAITSVADFKSKYGFGDNDKETILLEGFNIARIHLCVWRQHGYKIQ